MWDGSGLDFDELMSRAIKPLPQLTDRHLLGGMHEVPRQSGERTEHESALQQVRTRQLQFRLVAKQVAV